MFKDLRVSRTGLVSALIRTKQVFLKQLENWDEVLTDGDGNPAHSYGKFLYFTIITISTVGYGDIYPVSFLGRIFVCFFIISALVTLRRIQSSELPYNCPINAGTLRLINPGYCEHAQHPLQIRWGFQAGARIAVSERFLQRLVGSSN